MDEEKLSNTRDIRDRTVHVYTSKKNSRLTVVPQPLSSYLKLALRGENADPLVVVVSYDDVTTGVHSYTCRPLQLARRPSTHPKTTLEFPLIGENLEM